MTRLRIILFLVGLLVGFSAHAQSDTDEDRSRRVALQMFQDELWSRAEQEWRNFTIKYPLSPHLPEAVLYQARALIEMGNFPGAIQLLQQNQAQAGALASEYLFWIAESQFREEKYTAAAETYERLTLEYPDSPRALEAVLGQASSRGRQKKWDQVIAILQNPAGIFLEEEPTDQNHELLARCQLLLAEAFLAVRNYSAAKTALADARLNDQSSSLQWQRQFLLARALLALEQLPEALTASSNLVTLANSSGRANLVAEAVLFQGRVFERMDRVDQSVAVYRQNLTSTNIPPVAQRQTLLRLSDLLITRGRLAEAQTTIEQLLSLNPEPATADLARVTIAELKLRQAIQESSAVTNGLPTTASNLVEQAVSDLNAVIQSSTDPLMRGKAFLNQGWAEWMRRNYGESSAAFEQAALLLPPSENQAVARYKWADARFQLGDLEGARTNYEFVAESAPGIGGAATELIEPALYQTLRAGLAMDRPDLTTNVLDHLLQAYPDRFLASAAVLLTGQKFNDTGDPAAARALFNQFLKLSPDSQLAPQIRLAVARTYEAEGDWASAILNYDAMITATNPAPVQARAEYFRALDTAMSGDETNALAQFTSFVAAHPNDELAPSAQWWIGDYHWRRGDYINAELNYQLVFKNWPNADTNLAYNAKMMAGRTAMARARPEDAITYFTNLTSDLNCPPDLRPKAMFAYGDALMRLKSADTNDPLANVAEAIRVYSGIERSYPSNILAARAQGMVAQCYLQFALQDTNQYSNASNSFQQVIDSPWADFALRSQAEVGLGDVMEKLALLQTGESRTNLLQQSLDHYLKVFYYEQSLRDGEEPDQFWVRKAGLAAGRLAESLQLWTQALKIYQRLQDMIPSLKPLLENKILKLQEQVTRLKT